MTEFTISYYEDKKPFTEKLKDIIIEQSKYIENEKELLELSNTITKTLTDVINSIATGKF